MSLWSMLSTAGALVKAFQGKKKRKAHSLFVGQDWKVAPA